MSDRTSTERAELERIRGFARAFAERRSERSEPFRWGTALFVDRLPRVWDLNVLRVDHLPRTLAARRLASEADRLQGAAGLAHRKVVIDDEDAGARVAPGFATLGWTSQPLLVMVHRGGQERPPAGVEVREVGESTVRPAHERFLRALPHGDDDETIRQLLEEDAGSAQATSLRRFAALVDGEVAGYCRLYSDGAMAQVEDVGTLAPHRGRGLARAVVLSAVDAALRSDHELVFLTARDDDWPKDLYRRMGFEAIGRIHGFARAAAR